MPIHGTGLRKLALQPSEASSLFGETVKALVRHYGLPAPLPVTDPFELVLWGNVAYLALPARRREAFELLRSSIGTNPTAILAATRRALERVCAYARDEKQQGHDGGSGANEARRRGSQTNYNRTLRKKEAE